MATTKTVIIGGITNQIPFIITSIINDVVNFLNIRTTTTNGTSIKSYYWEPDLNIIGVEGAIPVFSAATTFSTGVPSGQVIFIDNTNNGGLGFISSPPSLSGNVIPLPPANSVIGFALEPGNIVINLQQYASWLEPFILLAGTDYQLLTTNGTAAFIPTKDNVFIPCNRIQFIPTIWYYNCNNGECQTISNSFEAAVQWLCNQDPPNSTNKICTQQDPSYGPIIPKGWSNINEAATNIFYSYCPSGSSCGSGGSGGPEGCNGPCSIFYYSCVAIPAAAGSGTFGCQFNKTLFVDDFQWWKDPFFIGLIIVLMIIIITIVSLIIYFTTRKS